jgi:hypothetical protein
MILRLLVLFSMLAISLNANARRRAFEYQRPIWSMGMGGVYTPFPREADMPTANAAYLATVKSFSLEVMNIMLGAPGMDKIQDIQNLPPMDDLSDLNGYMGKTIWTAADGRFSAVMPYLGVSLYNNFYLESYFSNPLMPEWYLNFSNDAGFTMAGAMALGPDVFVGLGVKRITRWGGSNVIGFDLIDQYIQTQDSNVILDQFQNKGLGYGVDLSVLYKPENNKAPTMTIVWKDVGYTTFQKTEGTGNPPHLADNLIFGVGYEWDGPGLDTKLGFEYRNITTRGMQFGEKLHFGSEFSLPLVDLRFGLNQGYMTYGLGLDLWFFRLELAQYTMEAGEYPGQTPDQRLQIGFSVDLEVDANFNVTSANGQKRKLKQRR